MNAIITGGAGFVGYHLTRSLWQMGHHVTIYDNLSHLPLSRMNLEDLRDKATFIEGDVGDLRLFKRSLNENDVVFHLAGSFSPSECLERPRVTLETNALGTANVLEAARQADAERVVFLGSDLIYGDADHLPIDEQHPRRPTNPYAISKLAGVLYCEMYHRLYGLPTTSIISGNVFGERQDMTMVVPKFIGRALRNEPIIVHGGNQTRDFYYIENLVRVLTRVPHTRGIDGEVFNIGGGAELSILDLARQIISWTHSSSVMVHEPYRLDDKPTTRIWLDASKAKRSLSYEVKIGLEEGLKRTIRWISKELLTAERLEETMTT